MMGGKTVEFGVGVGVRGLISRSAKVSMEFSVLKLAFRLVNGS
jgi:hypothetical protein